MNSEAGFMPLQAQQGGIDFAFFLMMGAIFLIFYVLVIRPQQKQQREREAHLQTAAKGDDVVTNGGVHGRVTGVDGDVLEVEVAKLRGGEKVRLRISRARIDQLTKAGQGGDGGSGAGSKDGAKGGEA